MTDRTRRAARAACCAAAFAIGVLAACGRDEDGNGCLVRTGLGDVRGIDHGRSCAFLGIPFATPPVGGQRWKPTAPPAPWRPATLDAVVHPPPCPRIDPPGTDTISGSEDCLRLNVWMPSPHPREPAPVLVWIDGNDFLSASANAAAPDARYMAELTGAIVVAPNFRVGVLGFLGHAALSSEDAAYPASANYGLLDQRSALGWVREHISAFGGDPASVTMAGKLAGADSVGLHMVSPASAGYFARAIMQGGFASSRWRTLADAEAVGESLAAALTCTDRARVLDCLRSKTIRDVLLALPSGPPQFTETIRAPWGPVVDGLEVPDQPRALYERGAFHRVPVLIGIAGNEGWTVVDRAFPAGLSADVYRAEVEAEFGSADMPAILDRYPASARGSPKDALSALAGDVETICEARRVARLIARTNVPVSLYALEPRSSPLSVSADQAQRIELFAAAGYWTSFVATGNPVIADSRSVRWPSSCDFWERFFLRSVSGPVPASQP